MIKILLNENTMVCVRAEDIYVREYNLTEKHYYACNKYTDLEIGEMSKATYDCWVKKIQGGE